MSDADEPLTATAGGLIAREATARAIEGLKWAPNQALKDGIAFLAECVRNDRVIPDAVLSSTPAIPVSKEPITSKLLGEVMQDAWGEICDDAHAHPEDIRRQGRKTFYDPRHWTDLIALRLNERLGRTMPEGDSPFVPGSVWQEDGCWASEVQVVGGHYVVATVYAGSEAEAAARRDTVLRALTALEEESGD